MAIARKNAPKIVASVPVEFGFLMTRVARMQVLKDMMTNAYNGAKSKLEAYLEADNCPIQAAVGEKGPKVPDVGSVSFTQPEKTDHKQAAQYIVEAIKAGRIAPDNLLALVSTFNKDALKTVLTPSEQESVFSVNDEKVTLTIRVAKEFKMTQEADLLTGVSPIDLKEIEELTQEGNL